MEILIKPKVTEKATVLSDKLNKYSFIVEKRANKIQIKDAVEQYYNVTVEDVNTVTYFGKYKKRYTKNGLMEGRTNSYKKAIVSLKEGEKIDFYSNI